MKQKGMWIKRKVARKAYVEGHWVDTNMEEMLASLGVAIIMCLSWLIIGTLKIGHKVYVYQKKMEI